MQYAALPYRVGAAGAIEVMLLTSRQTKRWVVPKGWPMKGKRPWRVAEIEAREEAGIIGRAAKTSIGSYHYSKDMSDGELRLLAVEVFPVLVRTELQEWREAHERTRAWHSVADATSLVSDGGLALLIGCLETQPTRPVRTRKRLTSSKGSGARSDV